MKQLDEFKRFYNEPADGKTPPYKLHRIVEVKKAFFNEQQSVGFYYLIVKDKARPISMHIPILKFEDDVLINYSCAEGKVLHEKQGKVLFSDTLLVHEKIKEFSNRYAQSFSQEEMTEILTQSKYGIKYKSTLDCLLIRW